MEDNGLKDDNKTQQTYVLLIDLSKLKKDGQPAQALKWQKKIIFFWEKHSF